MGARKFRISFDIKLIISYLDGAFETFSDEFLRIIPNPGTPQGHPPLRGECPTVWFTSRIHWSRYQGTEFLSFIPSPLSIHIYLSLTRRTSRSYSTSSKPTSLHFGPDPMQLMARNSALKISLGNTKRSWTKSFSISFFMRFLGSLLSLVRQKRNIVIILSADTCFIHLFY